MTQKGAEYELRPPAADDTWSLSGPGAGAGVLAAVGADARPASLRPASHPAPLRRVGDLAAKVSGSPVLVAAASALLLLPVSAQIPSLRAPALRATIETAITLLAFAGAWLLRAKCTDSRHLRDRLTMAAAITLGILNLSVAVLPPAAGVHAAQSLAAAALWGQLFVAGSFAAACLVGGDVLVPRSRRRLALVGALPLAGVAVAVIGGFTAGGLVVSATGHIATASGPLSHPLGLVVAFVAIGLLGYAAVMLDLRARRSEADPTAATLAAAVILLSAAGLYRLIIGPVPAGDVSLSQLPQIAAFVLVLLAAVRHEPQARARVTKAAALAERRRVAQDLHDRLAQDLAFIAAHAPSMAEHMGDGHPVVVAARRALAISRSTISELSDPAGSTAAESLEAVAQELRDQFDIAIAVNVVLDTDLEPQAREHVTRISREAIANAARHGGARNVAVSLRRLELAVVLRVVDDGCGIADARGAAAPEGFGLGSMRERAAALGGYLSVHQPRYGGTEVEVVFR